MHKILMMTTLSSIVLLSSCGKKVDYTSDSVQTESAAIGVDEIQNPEQIVSDQQAALEQNRQLVKQAQLNFQVQDINKTTSAIETKLSNINGYVEAKNINYRVDDYQARNKLDGTIDVFEKVTPTVQLVVRIPNSNVTTFLNEIIPLMLNFNQQNYEAKRYQLKLLEEQLKTATQTSGSTHSISSQLQKLTVAEAQDRLQYSTVELNYHQISQLRQSHDINIQRVAELHSDPFFSRIWQSIKLGAIGIRETVVWLFMIWPIYIVMLICYMLFKHFSKRKKNRESN